jgi:hypothetical protein
MRKTSNKRPLFDLPSSSSEEPKRKVRKSRKSKEQDVQKESTESPKRRRRRKNKESETPVEPVAPPTTNIQTDSEWKDFSTNKPEPLVPVEFRIDKGKGKYIQFRGYMKEKRVTCTDEPYKLTVLRKKYGNLFYREIPGCTDIQKCPDQFPTCEGCPNHKTK